MFESRHVAHDKLNALIPDFHIAWVNVHVPTANTFVFGMGSSKYVSFFSSTRARINPFSVIALLLAELTW